MVISKRQRLFGKGYTGGSWDAGKNLFLYPGGSLISLCITIVFHALCFNCDVSSQHKAGCSQRWKRNAELCECKVSTVKSQLRPKQPWSFGFNLQQWVEKGNIRKKPAMCEHTDDILPCVNTLMTTCHVWSHWWQPALHATPHSDGLSSFNSWSLCGQATFHIHVGKFWGDRMWEEVTQGRSLSAF